MLVYAVFSGRSTHTEFLKGKLQINKVYVYRRWQVIHLPLQYWLQCKRPTPDKTYTIVTNIVKVKFVYLGDKNVTKCWCGLGDYMAMLI